MRKHPANIAEAYTIHKDFYLDKALFEQSKSQVFTRTWQYACDIELLKEQGSIVPVTLLEGFLDEPLLFTRDSAGQIHALSNVCTHRGNLMVQTPGLARAISCGYHGRCFALDGRMTHMPGFEGVENFPSASDHLPSFSWVQFGPLLLVNLSGQQDASAFLTPIISRLSFLPMDTLRFSAEYSKDYPLAAHWALYCDNYLEGFHIPFVHPALNAAIEPDDYRYEQWDWGNLQLAIAKAGQPCFEIPEGHVDHGLRVYAYYCWLFPNLMLNIYPWGLSLNVVKPRGLEDTVVHYRTYFFEGYSFDRELNRIEQTEEEDQAVILSVQRGLKSQYYSQGRYSVKHESGVFQFHQLIIQAMGSDRL